MKTVSQKISKQLKCRASVHPSHDDRRVSKKAVASFINGEAESTDNVKDLF